MKNIPYKRKLGIIATGIVLITWAAYQFSFLRTIELWRENGRLEQQRYRIKEIPDQLPVLTAKVDKLKKILGNGQEDFSNLILSEVNSLCQQQNIRLNEIPEKHIYEGENLIVETVDINLQGNFADQVRIISKLEKNDAAARVRSVKFQLVKDQTTGERNLLSTVFLQSIKLSNSNSSDHEKTKNQ